MSRGSVLVASGLEESDSDDRPIGKLIAKVEKKKSVAKRKSSPIRAMEDEAEEDVPPLRRKNEKIRIRGHPRLSQQLLPHHLLSG